MDVKKILCFNTLESVLEENVPRPIKFESNWSYKLPNRQSSNQSKSLWPISYLEFAFLPEFKIRRNGSSQYKFLSFLGKGAFGRVYQVRRISENYSQEASDDDFYALKILSKAKIINEDGLRQLKDEVGIQSLISHHQFIVKSHSSWQDKKNIYLLNEYVSNGELFQKVQNFPYELIQIYVAELAIVLDFLHNAGIIYRDLKPENILLDVNHHILLIDFGLSKWLKLGNRTKTLCGTKDYMVLYFTKMNARSQIFELSIEGRQVDEAVASLFHTVLFHRALGKFSYTADTSYSVGTIGTMDVDCDFIDFTYVCSTSQTLDRKVKNEISQFSEQLRNNEGSATGQISLEFFQKKKNRWPMLSDETIPWEIWTCRVELVHWNTEDERQICRERVGDLLSDKILYITEVMNRHDYVPKMPNQTEVDLVFDTSFPDIQPYLFKFKFNTVAPTSSVSNTMKKLYETLSL